jgi:hypothetical protein
MQPFNLVNAIARLVQRLVKALFCTETLSRAQG